MAKKYIVRLTDEERIKLLEITKKGKSAARTIMRANVLLRADANGKGFKDSVIAEDLNMHVGTVEKIRKQLVLEGFSRALYRKSQEGTSRKPKLDGRAQAKLTALACSKAPDGHARWSLRLLANKLIELEVVDYISHDTVARALKKTSYSPIAVSIGVSRQNKIQSL